jgi:hypothetical protein
MLSAIFFWAKRLKTPQKIFGTFGARPTSVTPPLGGSPAPKPVSHFRKTSQSLPGGGGQRLSNGMAGVRAGLTRAAHLLLLLADVADVLGAHPAGLPGLLVVLHDSRATRPLRRTMVNHPK